MSRKRVLVGDLALGMYVAELDRPWLESPFLFQGFPIRSQEELAQLRKVCEFVYIDLEQSAVTPEPRPESPPQQPSNFETRRINVSHHPEGKRHVYPELQRFEAALPEAVQLYVNAKEYIVDIFHDIRLGHSIDTTGAIELTNRMADNIVKNESALVWLTQLKHRDEYTSLHSLNVCIISLLFGRHLGLSEEVLRHLGLGALLHDIGKMKIPGEILNKPDRLNEQEMALMRRHPEFGFNLLRHSETISPAARDIVLSHHERVDGSGYPRGRRGKELSKYALIVSMVDCYDAVTSNRAYHEAISPHEALHMMYERVSMAFPRKLLEEFIRCLGIYPIGSLVELDSGEVGVVMTVNRQHQLKPTLTVVLDSHKQPLDMPKLLNMEFHQEHGHELNIKKILRSNAYGIDIRQLILQTTLTLPAEQ